MVIAIMDLKGDGKLIVITGATSGLGLAMSEYYLNLSHTVIGCGRSQAKIAELNEKYEIGKAKFFVVDIASDNAVSNWADRVIKEFGPPDFLLNNAGVINENEKLWKISAETFNQVIDVNIKGAVNCIRHFAPEMIEAKKGIIVNFTSTWGKSVSGDVAPYCCSKWGLEGLSKSLALELPEPLACIPLNPGVIHTPMLTTVFGESAKHHTSPEEWVKRAGPFILGFDRRVNGKSLDV